MAESAKSPSAFMTIGELAEELALPQHILRYWETKFRQLRPMKRAGNRRYYRPEDANLARQINHLLNGEGYTVKGVQKLLAGGAGESKSQAPALQQAAPSAPVTANTSILPALKSIRERLANALAEDNIAARV